MSSDKSPGKLPKIPRWLIYTIILAVVLSWVPLAWILRSRTMLSDKRPVHLFLDMDIQPNYQPQETHPLYADHRAMRLPVDGTVARGELRLDDHFYRGYRTDDAMQPVQVAGEGGTQTLDYFDGYPEQVTVDSALLQRGRERYNVYCAVCHGRAGYGDGMVQRRVQQIIARNGPTVAQGWVPPRNLHEARVRELPVGQVFDVISRGVATMPGYASQIPVEDRWAIAAYVEALQLSQHYPADQLPQELRRQLDEAGQSDAPQQQQDQQQQQSAEAQAQQENAQ